jgi:putative oxidoreductase
MHAFLGAALGAHALQKLLVFRLGGTAAYLESLGFGASRLMALAVIATEFVGGGLLALGLLIPLGAALVASTMIVAARTDHRGKGWFITGAGAEYVTTNAAIAIALAALGGGRYSLDHALGINAASALWGAASAVIAVAGAGLVLSTLHYRTREGPAPQL